MFRIFFIVPSAPHAVLALNVFSRLISLGSRLFSIACVPGLLGDFQRPGFRKILELEELNGIEAKNSFLLLKIQVPRFPISLTESGKWQSQWQ